ncbi:MAG: hypothetical protein EPN85_06320 [Bacteroidetes bacterium]|nr:MAG: hypothetical protein EPN85_06320 [Bacteroidota bacterium]
MIKSLKRYLNYFSVTLLARKERVILVRDFFSYYLKKSFLKHSYSSHQKQKALERSISWLLHSQENSMDKGFGTYKIAEGWTGSYPETSGYIIPTLVSYAKSNAQNEMIKKAIDCADWLLSIQRPSGGWQSMYVKDNKPEVVFNTGQVIRGLVEIYSYTEEKKYLQSAIKACDWLCSIQEQDGSWKKFAFMNEKRVYDSYVDHPLLLVHKITGNETYRKTALRNLEWIINEKQLSNGWFQDCDNTIKHNDRPITHTIAYTIDGLLECGMYLKDDRFVVAAKKAADVLLDIFDRENSLNGRYDWNWKGSEYLICTGCAQLAIIWLKLYRLYKNEAYLYAATKMNNMLVYIQQRNFNERADTRGAMPGSFPIWGKYEPFAFPNWATKYFADSLMLELETTHSNN